LSQSSFDRFTRAAQKTKDFAAQPRTEPEAVKYAFDTLTNVAQKGYTQWNIVYDQKRGKIHFRSLKSPDIKVIDTRAFDYSCGSTVKIYEVNSKDPGDVTAKFADYTPKANRDLIERSFNGTDFLKGVPEIARDFIAAYPDTFTCKLNEPKAENTPTKTIQNTSGILGFFYAIYQYVFGV
jgi:hypothetical protein